MIVNEVELDDIAEKPTMTSSSLLAGIQGEGHIVHGLFSSVECDSLLRQLDLHRWEPVGVHGMKSGYADGEAIGSTRLTARSEHLATLLFNRVSLHLPRYRRFHGGSATDWDHHPLWRPVAINPLMRFIRYEDGGRLVAHYDGPYVLDETRRTLQSLVVYLDADPDLLGAGTRFIRDPQGHLPIEARRLEDWDRVARDDEVLLRLRPPAGTGVLFDHRILHDGEPARGAGRKTLLRTDLIWEKVR